MSGLRSPDGCFEASPRAPSNRIVVDANIILSAALGRRTRPLLEQVGVRRTLVASARAVGEVRTVLERHAPPSATARAELLIADLLVMQEPAYADRLDAATLTLAEAVPSRDAPGRDAHVLACAWACDADIWSHDRDFAGTGWPSWSNANLGRALAGQEEV